MTTAPTRLPWGGLLALAMAGFITILTETLPAGLLPQMGAGLAVSEALVGQLVTAYAVGSLLAAIPLVAFTRGWPRRRLLLVAIAGFAVVNTVTAVSHSYTLTLAARFLAGVFAGLLWALLAGHAARMVAPALQGRAIAVAMLGTPLALSLGVPAGTLLGALLGWRVSFGIMSGLTLVLILWVLAKVPEFPGQAAAGRLPLGRVFLMPGMRSVLGVTLGFVLAHNILYTYIAPFLAPLGEAGAVGTVLLAFGLAALLGIWLTGLLIQRALRGLVLGSILVFGAACLVLGLWAGTPMGLYAGIILWGFAFGGAATQFQTASSLVAGPSADVAQSMIVTVWNTAISGGGLLGGLILTGAGPAAFPWVMLALLAASLGIAWRAKGNGFPAAA